MVDVTYATVKRRLASPDKRSTIGGRWTVHCCVECNLAGRAIEVCCLPQGAATRATSREIAPYGSRQLVTAIKRERCRMLFSATCTWIYFITAVTLSVRSMSHHTAIYIYVTEIVSPLQVFHVEYCKYLFMSPFMLHSPLISSPLMLHIH